MDPAEVPDNSIVCFKREYGWFLFARWTLELREDYEFAHSMPYTSQKGNREPTFQEALFIHSSDIPPPRPKDSDPTLEELKTAYRVNPHRQVRTKIIDGILMCVIESI